MYCDDHIGEERMCVCIDQGEMVYCVDCMPIIKDKASKWNFYIPAFLFMVVNCLVLFPAITNRLEDMQAVQFVRRTQTQLQYEFNEGSFAFEELDEYQDILDQVDATTNEIGITEAGEEEAEEE